MEEYNKAIQYYEEISNIDLNDEIEYNLANCYYMKENNDEAIIHYKKALEINPSKPDCLYNLGNAYCQKENFEDALKCFEQSI